MNFLNTLKDKFSKRTILVTEIIAIVLVLAIIGLFVARDVAYKSTIVHKGDPHLSTDQIKERQTSIDKIRSEISQKESEKADKQQIFVLYSTLGAELGVIGEYDQALEALNKAKGLLPDNATIYADLAKLQISMRDYKGALKNIRRAVQINPASPDYWVTYVTLEKEQFKVSIEDRLKQLEEAKTKTASAPQVINQYALVLEEQGKLKEAYAMLREVVIANPGVQEYLQNLDRINIKIQQAEIKASSPR